MDTSYHNVTTLHPGVIAAVACACVWILLAARRNTVLPLLLLSCFVSPAQRIVVGGLDFTVTKILVLVFALRVVARGELGAVRWNRIDGAVAAWVSVGTLCFVATHGTFEAVVNRLGWALELLGVYLMFRVSVRGRDDLERVVRTLAWCALPVAGLFALELLTGENPFGALGGVEEAPREREGQLRCQGAFPHPIIAGVFWASLLPLMLVAAGRGRLLLKTAGITAAGFVIWATASSTPFAAVLLVAAGLAFYRYRGSLGLARWGAVAALLFLHFWREKPVWHLISRIDLSGGSTGYHRYELIDRALATFDVWALTGARDTEFLGMNDITNQFVLEGLNGGIVAMLALLCALVFAFVQVGRALRAARSRTDKRVIWALGVALSVHAASFLAVSYFGQGYLPFLLVLAAIAGLAGRERVMAREHVRLAPAA